MKGYESPGRAPAWATARSRRHSRLTYFIGIALTLLVIVWHFHVPSTPQELSDSSNLHILVPVVGRNINLCKMFLSAFANGYPTPILVGWNDNGEYDQEKQLEKVTTIKNYLTKLQRAGDHGDDIVLIVDGIDVMFQLGPEVLLSNYFETLQRLDNHVQQEYGRPDIHHTILFGAEKHCWPDPLMAPSCWMMPRSTVHPYAYGPYTSGHLTHSASTRAQPRWLNPGTIMGPVDDMARMYQAVLDHIKDDPIKDFNHKTSDQPHFDAVYVKQEQARLSQRPDILEGRYNDTLDMKFGGGERPKALDSGNHELHMGLDYGSSLFLPLLWQEPFLMWAKPSATESFPNASPDERKLLSYFHQPLPQVLQTSPRPFSKLNDTALARRDWSDVSLLHSVATRSIPPVIHFTIDSLRDPWWEKLWFQDTAQAFRLARMREGGAGQEKQRRISQSPIDERHWYNSEHISPSGDKGAAGQNYSLPGAGVWTEEGKWVTWENTCGEYEQWLFV